MEITYRIEGAGCGPKEVKLNGAGPPLQPRRCQPLLVMGAAEIPMSAVRETPPHGQHQPVYRAHGLMR